MGRLVGLVLRAAVATLLLALSVAVGWLWLELPARAPSAPSVRQPVAPLLRNGEGEYSVVREGKVLLVLAHVDEHRVCLRWREGGQSYCLDRPDGEPLMVQAERGR